MYNRLKEIEMNKRPPGTRLIDDFERRDLLRKMKTKEKELQDQFSKVCISQQTNRARNEYKGLEQELRNVQ